MAMLTTLTAEDLIFLHTAPIEAGPAMDWLSGDLPGAVARLEVAMIQRALDAAGGNRADAARRLNIHRQLLYEKLRRYGLDASANRTEPVSNSDAGGGE